MKKELLVLKVYLLFKQLKLIKNENIIIGKVNYYQIKVYNLKDEILFLK